MRDPMPIRVRALCGTVLFLAGVATSALAEDINEEITRRVQAQQEEERRMNEMARQLNVQVEEQADRPSDLPAYAPNSFVSFPPDAWRDFVKHAQDTHREEIEERFGKDPAYQALLKGTWTYRESDDRHPPPACEATFWTRNGGVSFIHLGGTVDLTLLGFFGASIPSVEQPRTITMELIQSGEMQKVRALNLHFGSIASMGMVLFNVHSPKILLDAIEDRQDFELRLDGKSIAHGEWHSGLAARDTLAACLKDLGVSSAR